MPGSSDVRPEDRTAWLLLIGRRLKAEYDALAEPVPARLATLIQQLETAPEEKGAAGLAAGQPDGRFEANGMTDAIDARRKRAR